METSLSASDAAAQDYAKAPWHDMPKAPLSPGGLASYSDSPPLLWHELPMLKLDAIDRKILAALQDNGRLSNRSEEPTSELQSLTRISYAVLCLKKTTPPPQPPTPHPPLPT